MSKSIKFKNDVYLDSNSVIHNKHLLSTLLNQRSDIKILYMNVDGLTASADGKAVTVNEPVTKFNSVLIVSDKGVGICDTTKLNQTISCGKAGNIWWFNGGLQGTYYSYTIYLVIGILRR